MQGEHPAHSPQMPHDFSDAGIGFLIFALAIYFVPAVVAFLRGHRSRLAILFVNLFLGWMLIGWLWAMIWSLTGNTERNARRD